jgi:hypothetical protein
MMAQIHFHILINYIPDKDMFRWRIWHDGKMPLVFSMTPQYFDLLALYVARTWNGEKAEDLPYFSIVKTADGFKVKIWELKYSQSGDHGVTEVMAVDPLTMDVSTEQMALLVDYIRKLYESSKSLGVFDE